MKNEKESQPDDFESRLQRLDLVKPPHAWRNDILTAARRAAEDTTHPKTVPADGFWTVFTTGLQRWVGWFGPGRAGWACVAGVWLVIFSLNIATGGREATPRKTDSASNAISEKTREHLKQQRLLMVELIGDAKESKVEQSKPLHPGHRSQRREETEVALA